MTSSRLRVSKYMSGLSRMYFFCWWYISFLMLNKLIFLPHTSISSFCIFPSFSVIFSNFWGITRQPILWYPSAIFSCNFSVTLLVDGEIGIGFEAGTSYSVKMSNEVVLYTKSVYNKPWSYRSESFSVFECLTEHSQMFFMFDRNLQHCIQSKNFFLKN